VAEIVSVRPHPHGDHIFLADVRYKTLSVDGVHQVVFGGASYLRPGDLVPAAPPGARLDRRHNKRHKLRQESFRGEGSFGMLCSAQELGWTRDGPDEVAVLLSAAYVGMSLDDHQQPMELVDPARVRYLEKNPSTSMFTGSPHAVGTVDAAPSDLLRHCLRRSPQGNSDRADQLSPLIPMRIPEPAARG
jgi:tRNA-binding EMAP/Myf-like protein